MFGDHDNATVIKMVCPYIEGEGYYCSWDDNYYVNHSSCIQASTVSVLGEPVIMDKSDFYMMSGTFGVLLSIVIVWAFLKSIL